MTTQTTEITARIYDTDGTEWSDLPPRRAGECLDDYAYRLYKWARAEILTSASYGDVEQLVDVEHPQEASVVVYAETPDCYVEYCILARQVSYEIADDERRAAIAADAATQEQLTRSLVLRPVSGRSPDEATRRARDHRVVVSVRLPQAAVVALDARCAELGVSRSQCVAVMLAVALQGGQTSN